MKLLLATDGGRHSESCSRCSGAWPTALASRCTCSPSTRSRSRWSGPRSSARLSGRRRRRRCAAGRRRDGRGPRSPRLHRRRRGRRRGRGHRDPPGGGRTRRRRDRRRQREGAMGRHRRARKRQQLGRPRVGPARPRGARGARRQGPVKVLIAADGSEGSAHAIRAFRGLADPARCTVEVLSVAPVAPLPPGGSAGAVLDTPDVTERELDAARSNADGGAATLRDDGFTVSTRAEPGVPARVILDATAGRRARPRRGRGPGAREVPREGAGVGERPRPPEGARVVDRPLSAAVDAGAFLDPLTADPDVAGSLVHVREIPARAPLVEPFPDDLPELLGQRLGLLGIEGLYPHQAEGLDALRSGRTSCSRPARRAARRSSTTSRSPTRPSRRRKRPRSSCSRRRRWRATSCVRCAP